MYEELYKIWKQETENDKLGKIPSNFYLKITEYLKKLSEESRMLDRKTVKAVLLKREMKNAKKMINGIVSTRYKKLLRKAVKGENISSNFLTSEEERIFSGFFALEETLPNFLNGLLRGRSVKSEIKQKKRVVFRFLKDVPAIIGVDLKTYGPFKTEDVGSLPVENAKILIKQGLAEKIIVD